MTSFESAFALHHDSTLLHGFEELLSPSASPMTMDPASLTFSSTSTSPYDEGVFTQPTSLPPSRGLSPRLSVSAGHKGQAPNSAAPAATTMTTETPVFVVGSTPYHPLSSSDITGVDPAGVPRSLQADVSGPIGQQQHQQQQQQPPAIATVPSASPFGTTTIGSYTPTAQEERRMSHSMSDVTGVGGGGGGAAASHHSQHSTSTSSSSLWSSSAYDGTSFPLSDNPLFPHNNGFETTPVPSSAATSSYNSFALQQKPIAPSHHATSDASTAHQHQQQLQLQLQLQHQQRQPPSTAIRIDTSSLGRRQQQSMANMQFASPFTPLATQLQQTKLFSPLGTDFVDSPAIVTPASALMAHHPTTNGHGLNGGATQQQQQQQPQHRRPGAMRTVSAIDLPRQRSSTLTGLSPATPTVGFNPYPYPHPSPLGAGSYTNAKTLNRRPSVPLLSMGQAPFVHLHVGLNGQALSPDMAGQGVLSPGSGGVTRKRLHPLPSGLSEEYMVWDQMGHGGGVGSGMGNDDGSGENVGDLRKKPPRFRPSKDQLDILIASYQQNKNPDAKTRETLAKMLGGGVKPKTLQIWFQNRRSKARAKEREALNPKALTLSTALDLSRPGGAAARRPSLEAELLALRNLIRNADDNVVVLPITVMSMSRWTRFLTPGVGRTRPDLGCSLELRSPNPNVSLYVVHSGETYRTTLSLVAPQQQQQQQQQPGIESMSSDPDLGAVASVQAAENPQLQADSVAVRLEVRPGRAAFSMWSSGTWRPVSDFSGGVVSAGGRLELTGDREMMLGAFTQVRHLIGGDNQNDTALSAAPLSAAMPATHSIFPKDWQFPATATTDHSAGSQMPGSTTPPVSSSVPPPTAPVVAGVSMQSSLSASAGMPNPMSTMFGSGSSGADGFAQPGADRHQRKRSCSAPMAPAFDPAQVVQSNANGTVNSHLAASTTFLPSMSMYNNNNNTATENTSYMPMFSAAASKGPVTTTSNDHGHGSAESSAASLLFPMDEWQQSGSGKLLADLPEESLSTSTSTMLGDQWMQPHTGMSLSSGFDTGAAADTGMEGGDFDALGLFTQTYGQTHGSGSTQGSSASYS